MTVSGHALPGVSSLSGQPHERCLTVHGEQQARVDTNKCRPQPGFRCPWLAVRLHRVILYGNLSAVFLAFGDLEHCIASALAET